MITSSFDKSKPIISLEDSYGEKKHILDKCIVIFSNVIYQSLFENYNCEKIAGIVNCNRITDIYMFNYNGENIAFYLSAIGSTMASQFVIECNHLTGATKFVMFGSAGTLNDKKTKGKFVIPTYAYRDEGMSYHYKKPTDYIKIKNSKKVENIFKLLKLPYVKGRVWTTDAMLRETVGLFKKRKKEGCIAVDMELAGVQAVCYYHKLKLYNFLATGDILNEKSYNKEGLSDANHNLDKLNIALEIIKRI